jgi:hypothetical protein
VADAYAAGWPISAFAKHGIGLSHASLSKSEIYVNVVPLFTSGRVRLLNHQRMVDQLCGLKRKLRQGHERAGRSHRRSLSARRCRVRLARLGEARGRMTQKKISRDPAHSGLKSDMTALPNGFGPRTRPQAACI